MLVLSGVQGDEFVIRDDEDGGRLVARVKIVKACDKVRLGFEAERRSYRIDRAVIDEAKPNAEARS